MIRTFSSSISAYIEGFLAQKKALGYTYVENERYLFNFDKLCRDKYPLEKTITRDMAMYWAQALPDEGRAALSRRMSPIRELARYMIQRDIDAFVIPVNCGKWPNAKYVPHIFTDDELKKIFQESNWLKSECRFPTGEFVAPVLLRLMYSCGLRPFEARLIKRKNIDLRSGIIFIPESKKHKDRAVPMCDEMRELCIRYDDRIKTIAPTSEYFFPSNSDPLPHFGNHWISNALARCLSQAGITEFTGNKPRPYDFRHTFATKTLYRWFKEGRDLENCLPYLSAYMGHSNFHATAYYIHLVPEFFSQLPKELSEKYSNILPEVEYESC